MKFAPSSHWHQQVSLFSLCKGNIYFITVGKSFLSVNIMSDLLNPHF